MIGSTRSAVAGFATVGGKSPAAVAAVGAPLMQQQLAYRKSNRYADICAAAARAFACRPDDIEPVPSDAPGVKWFVISAPDGERHVVETRADASGARVLDGSDKRAAMAKLAHRDDGGTIDVVLTCTNDFRASSNKPECAIHAMTLEQAGQEARERIRQGAQTIGRVLAERQRMAGGCPENILLLGSEDFFQGADVAQNHCAPMDAAYAAFKDYLVPLSRAHPAALICPGSIYISEPLTAIQRAPCDQDTSSILRLVQDNARCDMRMVVNFTANIMPVFKNGRLLAVIRKGDLLLHEPTTQERQRGEQAERWQEVPEILPGSGALKVGNYREDNLTDLTENHLRGTCFAGRTLLPGERRCMERHLLDVIDPLATHLNQQTMERLLSSELVVDGEKFLLGICGEFRDVDGRPSALGKILDPLRNGRDDWSAVEDRNHYDWILHPTVGGDMQDEYLATAAHYVHSDFGGLNKCVIHGDEQRVAAMPVPHAGNALSFTYERRSGSKGVAALGDHDPGWARPNGVPVRRRPMHGGGRGLSPSPAPESRSTSPSSWSSHSSDPRIGGSQGSHLSRTSSDREAGNRYWWNDDIAPHLEAEGLQAIRTIDAPFADRLERAVAHSYTAVIRARDRLRGQEPEVQEVLRRLFHHAHAPAAQVQACQDGLVIALDALADELVRWRQEPERMVLVHTSADDAAACVGPEDDRAHLVLAPRARTYGAADLMQLLVHETSHVAFDSEDLHYTPFFGDALQQGLGARALTDDVQDSHAQFRATIKGGEDPEALYASRIGAQRIARRTGEPFVAGETIARLYERSDILKFAMGVLNADTIAAAVIDLGRGAEVVDQDIRLPMPSLPPRVGTIFERRREVHRAMMDAYRGAPAPAVSVDAGTSPQAVAGPSHAGGASRTAAPKQRPMRPGGPPPGGGAASRPSTTTSWSTHTSDPRVGGSQGSHISLSSSERQESREQWWDDDIVPNIDAIGLNAIRAANPAYADRLEDALAYGYAAVVRARECLQQGGPRVSSTLETLFHHAGAPGGNVAGCRDGLILALNDVASELARFPQEPERLVLLTVKPDNAMAVVSPVDQQGSIVMAPGTQRASIRSLTHLLIHETTHVALDTEDIYYVRGPGKLARRGLGVEAMLEDVASRGRQFRDTIKSGRDADEREASMEGAQRIARRTGEPFTQGEAIAKHFQRSHVLRFGMGVLNADTITAAAMVLGDAPAVIDQKIKLAWPQVPPRAEDIFTLRQRRRQAIMDAYRGAVAADAARRSSACESMSQPDLSGALADASPGALVSAPGWPSQTVLQVYGWQGRPTRHFPPDHDEQQPATTLKVMREGGRYQPLMSATPDIWTDLAQALASAYGVDDLANRIPVLGRQPDAAGAAEALRQMMRAGLSRHWDLLKDTLPADLRDAPVVSSPDPTDTFADTHPQFLQYPDAAPAAQRLYTALLDQSIMLGDPRELVMTIAQGMHQRERDTVAGARGIGFALQGDALRLNVHDALGGAVQTLSVGVLPDHLLQPLRTAMEHGAGSSTGGASPAVAAPPPRPLRRMPSERGGVTAETPLCLSAQAVSTLSGNICAAQGPDALAQCARTLQHLADLPPQVQAQVLLAPGVMRTLGEFVAYVAPRRVPAAAYPMRYAMEVIDQAMRQASDDGRAAMAQRALAELLPFRGGERPRYVEAMEQCYGRARAPLSMSPASLMAGQHRFIGCEGMGEELVGFLEHALGCVEPRARAEWRDRIENVREAGVAALNESRTVLKRFADTTWGVWDKAGAKKQPLYQRMKHLARAVGSRDAKHRLESGSVPFAWADGNALARRLEKLSEASRQGRSLSISLQAGNDSTRVLAANVSRIKAQSAENRARRDAEFSAALSAGVAASGMAYERSLAKASVREAERMDKLAAGRREEQAKYEASRKRMAAQQSELGWLQYAASSAVDRARKADAPSPYAAGCRMPRQEPSPSSPWQGTDARERSTPRMLPPISMDDCMREIENMRRQLQQTAGAAPVTGAVDRSRDQGMLRYATNMEQWNQRSMARAEGLAASIEQVLK